MYYQCEFQKLTKEGTMKTVAWIEERGAKKGVMVELKGEEGLWTVTNVTTPGINKEEFEATKDKSRHKFASLKD